MSTSYWEGPPEVGAPIESSEEFGSWMLTSGAKNIFAIVSNKDGTKLHIVTVNGEDEFLMSACMVMMDFIQYCDERFEWSEGDPEPQKNRAERRRAKKERRN